MFLYRILFTAIFVFFLNVAFPAYGAEVSKMLHPYITIEEEYNDNLYLTATNETEDFITTIRPGIKFANMDEVSGIEFDYSLGAVFYAKESDQNYISHNALLNAKYMTAEHINFYLKESFIRSQDNREQEYFTLTDENRYVLSYQTTRSTYWRNVFAPTVEYQFGPDSRIGLNYRNNIYETNAVEGDNSQENYINPFISYWFNRKNGIFLEYGYTKGDFDIQSDMTAHMGRGRYTNRFSPRSSVFVEHTYTKRTFDLAILDYEINEPAIGITYAFAPGLIGSAQVGYYWMDPVYGTKEDGITYKGSLTTTDKAARTTIYVSFQGGYTEDYFTAGNAGFTKYHRLTGSLTYQPSKRSSVGCFGDVERAQYTATNHTDDIWGAGVRASYQILKWLSVSAEYSHSELQSNVDVFDYKENKVILRLTAAY